jgi:hypothetical protein
MNVDDLWIPLVDEPIGSIVREIQEAHPEIDRLVVGARKTLAFRTFAYLRVGMLLGRLLVDRDVTAFDEAWVGELLRDPANYEAVVREVRAVAAEIGAAESDGPDGDVEPDEDTRARFREFARRQLG